MSNIKTISNCEVCGETNVAEIDFLGTPKIVNVACKCRQAERTALEFQEKLDNTKYLNKKYNRILGFEMSKLNTLNLRANKYADNFHRNFTKNIERCNGQWFYLYGVAGNGKTTTLMRLSQFINDNGEEYIFTSVDKIFMKIKDSFSSETITEQWIINRLVKCKYLMLDDVGVERITDWGGQIIYSIFNEKYNNGTCIIMTSNLDKSRLVEYISTFDKENRIIDRLKEKTTFVKFEGESFRKNEFKF